MSSVVCHVDLAQRGAVAASARLVDTRTSAGWTFARSGGESDDAPRESVTALARWIVQQLAASSATPDVTLCLDVDQATCGWVTASGSDDKAVKAAVRDAQAGEREDAGQTTPANWLKVGEPNADLSVQALSPPPVTGKRPGKATAKGTKPAKAAATFRERLAIVALPDLAARVLMDELDRVDQPVSRIMTLWHAIAEAWDPTRADTSAVLKTSSARVVADDASAGASATVVLDPRGRLLWTWQQGGRMLCAGSFRLASVSLAPEPVDGADAAASVPQPLLEVTASEISRLTADWLAWAAQIGTAPTFISIVGQAELAAAGLTEKFNSASPLAAVALAIGGAMPGSAVAAHVEPSPIEATLRRVLERNTVASAAQEEVDPRTGLVELASRPGKASRMVYRWSAAAVTAAALVLVALCVRVSLAASAAAEGRTKAIAARAALLKTLVPVAPKIMTESRQSNYLQTLLTERERQRAAVVPEKPIVPELARLLAAASSMPNLTLKRLTAASTTGFSADFNVPDASAVDQLKDKLSSIPPNTSEFLIWDANPNRIGDVFTVRATGTWSGKASTNDKGDEPRAAQPVAKPEIVKPADQTDKPPDANPEPTTENKAEVKPEPKPPGRTPGKANPRANTAGRGQLGPPSAEKRPFVPAGDPSGKLVPDKTVEGGDAGAAQTGNEINGGSAGGGVPGGVPATAPGSGDGAVPAGQNTKAGRTTGGKTLEKKPGTQTAPPAAPLGGGTN